MHLNTKNAKSVFTIREVLDIYCHSDLCGGSPASWGSSQTSRGHCLCRSFIAVNVMGSHSHYSIVMFSLIYRGEITGCCVSRDLLTLSPVDVSCSARPLRGDTFPRLSVRKRERASTVKVRENKTRRRLFTADFNRLFFSSQSFTDRQTSPERILNEFWSRMWNFLSADVQTDQVTVHSGSRLCVTFWLQVSPNDKVFDSFRPIQ